MKRILFLSIILLASLFAAAQTQKGYVKTKGRLDAQGKLIPGKGLKGATVSVQGRSAMLVNSNEGAFSFPVTTERFKLDSVKKKGYQLVDIDACHRTYVYSKNPLVILMETPEHQLQDQLSAERKIRRNLQQQLQKREEEIENLKLKQKLSDGEYRTALQKLYQEQEDNEQLIKDMAKRYSELDYDQLDEFYRRVSYCIENGELVKADSLLKTRGDITAQVANIKQRGQTLHEERSQLEKSEAVQQADIEEAARRCYSYYETYKAQHLNDTAAYFIELRASLDTTNVEWLMDAGNFIRIYVANYDKALNYFQVELRQLQRQKEVEPQKTALCYDEIGLVYRIQGNYSKALECYFQALDILQSSLGQNHPDVATNYDNIGVVYYKLGDYEKALEYHNKALIIRKTLFDENHPDVATSYNNIGSVYESKGDYEKALEYYNKTMDIGEKVFDENHPNKASCYNNIGYVYSKLGDSEKAVEYYKKALVIRKTVYGENHPEVASSYNNLGSMYAKKGDYEKAVDLFSKALSIRESILGKNHPDVAYSYNNIGVVYYVQGNYEKALEYCRRALSIRESVLGENHLDVAYSYNNIGSVYQKMEDFETALKCYHKALAILEERLGPDHNNTQTVKAKISEIEAKMIETGKE